MNMEKLLLGVRRYTGAILAAAKYLALYPFLSAKKANKFCFGVLALQDRLGYRCDRIPVMPLIELLPEACREDVSLGKILPWEGSSLSAEEMINLCAMIRHLQPKRVFEFGTSMGATAYNLALNLPNDGVLLTLDLPPVAEMEDGRLETAHRVTVSDKKMIYADRRHRRFIGTQAGEKITQLYGDSATFDYSPYHGSCDVVFVDGSHAYEYVKSDSDVAFRIVKPGGWVIWHDYNDGFFWPDVRRHLRELGAMRKIVRIKGTMLAVCHG